MALAKLTCHRLPLLLVAWVIICMVYLSATRPTWTGEWKDRPQSPQAPSFAEDTVPGGHSQLDVDKIKQNDFELSAPHPNIPKPPSQEKPSPHETFDEEVNHMDQNHGFDIPKPEPFPEHNGASEYPYADKEEHNVTIWENAHLLPDADFFRSHFDAVFSLPAITMKQAKETCTWGDWDGVNFQYGGDVDWMKEPITDTEVQEMRKKVIDFVKNGMMPWHKYQHHFKGRGIVLAGGNELSYWRIEVICRQLRRLKSTIPMEIHYWGNEMNPTKMSTLKGLYPHLLFNDMSDPETNIEKTQLSPLINWHLKSVALFNSRFEEALMLDADNIPVIDPALLFESKTYQEYGAVFWPDIARTRPQNPVWAVSNTPCKMDEYEAESGQLLVNKRKYWYHLQLSFWMHDHTDGWFNRFLLGDKDMFRFAWHTLKTTYGRPKYWLTSVGTLNKIPGKEDDFFCGHSFAQHHPDTDQIAFLHGGTLKSMSRAVMGYQKEHGGVFHAYKKAPHPDKPEEIVEVGILWDGAEYMPVKDPKARAGFCTDFRKSTPGDITEVLPGGFEHIFQEIGGYWPLDLEYDPREKHDK